MEACSPSNDRGARADGEVLEPLLPPELPWLYAVIPLPAAYLMRQGLMDLAPAHLLFILVKCYLPFCAFGGAFHVVYRRLMPALLRRVTGPARRALLHVAVMLAVVLVVSLPLFPLIDLLVAHSVARVNFVLVSIIFSAACLFPSLALQSHRLRARRAEHWALRAQKAALEAQLQALQARTDPHFLFNSLNTIASLIPENPQLAERTLERLSDLFRYTLESSGARTVKLERELAMLSDYLEIQAARFGPRLCTRLTVADGVGDLQVPPLLLQPLVENAILHGTAQRRGGKVEIVVRRERAQLIVEVADDGPGLGRSNHVGAGTGVNQVTERLRLHYDARASLSYANQPQGGCLARLAFPVPVAS